MAAGITHAALVNHRSPTPDDRIAVMLDRMHAKMCHTHAFVAGDFECKRMQCRGARASIDLGLDSTNTQCRERHPFPPADNWLIHVLRRIHRHRLAIVSTMDRIYGGDKQANPITRVPGCWTYAALLPH